MSDVTWARAAPVLADWDSDSFGTLLDVAVDGTTLADWQALLDALPSLPNAHATCIVDGDPAPWPTDAGAAWRLADDATVLLHLRLPQLALTGHLYGVGGMEFDVEIRTLTNAGRWEELLAFARWVSTILGRTVDLASEYDHSVVLTSVPGPG